MSQTLDFFTINSRRAVMKVPITSLCIQAGVSTRAYHDALAGSTEPRPATLARLNAALGRFKMAYAGDKGPMSVHATYRAALVLAAAQLKADAKAVMFSDPSRRATADKEWLEAARVRRLGYWITSNMLGFGVSDVARAAGVTKQAVSSAIREVEDDPEPAMAAARAHLEEVFT